MRLRNTLLTILLFLVAGGAFCDENLLNPDGDFGAPEVILRSIQLRIIGKTRETAVLREMRLGKDMVFENREQLVSTIEGEIQELWNLRVFTEIDYQLFFRDSTDSDTEEAFLTLNLQDSWSFFPFVVPQGDGGGTRLTAAVVDTNFLGTLTTMTFSGSVSISKDHIEDRYSVSDWDTYFEWAGFKFSRWEFASKLSFGFVTDRKLENDLVTMDVNYYRAQWTNGFRYELLSRRHLYLHFLPNFGGNFNYKVRVDDGNIEYQFFQIGIGFYLERNRVNWHGFLREGWDAGFLYYPWFGDNGLAMKYYNAYSIRSSGFFLAGKFNPNYRFIAYLSPGFERTSLGQEIRGVNTHVMYGDRSLILNTGVQFRIYGGESLELHLQPFVDMGIAVPEDESIDWADQYHLGVGSELIMFFPSLPSLVIRGWFGVDVMVDDWSSSNKWQLGLSLSQLY